MACFKAEKKESYSTELQTIKTTIHNKFKNLHISLDERESDLLFELEGIRGTIESAIKQWERKIEDVKHTKSHANTEIRDNKWSHKLLAEANEELSLLETSKPCFEVEFKLEETIEDVFSSLGEITMEKTNRKRTKLFIKSDPMELTGDDERFQQPTPSDILTEPYFCPIITEEKCEFERKKLSVGQYPKLKNSVSCLEMSNMDVLKPEMQAKNTMRAFDDSCIVRDRILPTPTTVGKQQQQQQQQQ